MTEQTDLDAYLALLKRFGISYESNIITNSVGDEVTGVTCTVDKDGPQVTGYDGFLMTWEFNTVGKFITAGLWE